MAARCLLCGGFLKMNEHHAFHLEFHHKIKEPDKLGGRETFIVPTGKNSHITSVKYTGMWERFFREESI